MEVISYIPFWRTFQMLVSQVYVQWTRKSYILMYNTVQKFQIKVLIQQGCIEIVKVHKTCIMLYK